MTKIFCVAGNVELLCSPDGRQIVFPALLELLPDCAVREYCPVHAVLVARVALEVAAPGRQSIALAGIEGPVLGKRSQSSSFTT